jgi:hypothetical protein
MVFAKILIALTWQSIHAYSVKTILSFPYRFKNASWWISTVSIWHRLIVWNVTMVTMLAMIFVSNCLLTALMQQNQELVFNAKEIITCNSTHVFQSIPISLIAGYTVKSQMSPPVFTVSSDSSYLLGNACKYLPFAL